MITHIVTLLVCFMISFTEAVERTGFCGKFELVVNIEKMWTCNFQANFCKWRHILEINNHYIKLILIYIPSSCSTLFYWIIASSPLPHCLNIFSDVFDNISNSFFRVFILVHSFCFFQFALFWLLLSLTFMLQ